MTKIFARCDRHGDYFFGTLDESLHFTPVANGCPRCAADRLRRAEETKWREVAIPERFHGARIEDFNATTAAQKAVKRAVESYAAALSSEKAPSCGLLMHGRAGTGKTMLAAALAILAQKKGHSSRFVVMPKMIRSVTSTWGGASDLTEDDIIDNYASVDFLVIDEVARMRSETINDIFFQVVNERYERMKPTVVTTNASGEALDAFLEARTMRRIISDGGMALNFNWEPEVPL